MPSYIGPTRSRPPVHKFQRPNFIPSPQTKSKMNTYIDYLVDTAEKKPLFSQKTGREYWYELGFLTLTLPFDQVTERGKFIQRNFCKNKFCHHYWGNVPGALKYSDNEIKEKLLNQFFTELRNRYDVQRYMWKAETQANGRIHFHIIIDVFIYHIFLRNMWNRICSKLEKIPVSRKTSM